MWEECECESVSECACGCVCESPLVCLFLFFFFPSALSPSFLVLIWGRVFPCCHLPAILCASFVPALSPFSLPGTHTAYIHHGVQAIRAACTESTSYLFFSNSSYNWPTKLQITSIVRKEERIRSTLPAFRWPSSFLTLRSCCSLLFFFFLFSLSPFSGFLLLPFLLSRQPHISFYLFTSPHSVSLPRLPQLQTLFTLSIFTSYRPTTNAYIQLRDLLIHCGALPLLLLLLHLLLLLPLLYCHYYYNHLSLQRWIYLCLLSGDQIVLAG